MVSKIPVTTLEDLMTRLQKLEDDQNDLIGAVAALDATYLDDLETANIGIAAAQVIADNLATDPDGNAAAVAALEEAVIMATDTADDDAILL